MLLANIMQQCCNATISRNPTGTEQLRKFDGKVIALTFGKLVIKLRVTPNGMLEAVHRQVYPDAEVLFPMSRLSGSDEALQTHGNADLLTAFKEVFGADGFNLDTLAEQFFGPAAGSATAQAVEQGRSFCQQARERLGSSLHSWLVEESKLVPAAKQFHNYNQQVHEFASRVESLRQQMAEQR